MIELLVCFGVVIVKHTEEEDMQERERERERRRTPLINTEESRGSKTDNKVTVGFV